MATPLGSPFNQPSTVPFHTYRFNYPDHKKYHGLHTWAFGLIIASVVVLVLGFISIFLVRRSSPSPPVNKGAAPLPPPEEHLVDVSLVELEDPGKQCASDGEDSGKKKNVESEKKSTSAQSTITPSSPYYVGSSDSPGTPLVAVSLKGENYCNWARSMKTALHAKQKLGFIDGSIKKPAAGSSEFYDWEKVDSMVTAWIINSTDPTLHSSISHATTAREVWLDLEERFAQTNATRIQQLWRTLCILHQEPDTSVTSLYTNFKGLMDELSELQPLPQCNCGASKEMAQRERDQQVHLFLGSLDNERFGQVKGTLLNTDPLPSLHCVFNHVLREEARFVAEKDKEPRTESGAAFYTSKGKSRVGSEGGSAHLPCADNEQGKNRIRHISGQPNH